jgi:4-carboxymuconolactone decarboxylase
MSTPANVDVDAATRDALNGLSLDAPPASYLWQVSNALDSGASPADILGVLRAVAPQVGGPRVIGAAPEIMVALGLALPDGDV